MNKANATLLLLLAATAADAFTPPESSSAPANTYHASKPETLHTKP
jgi:hypothetical protein